MKYWLYVYIERFFFFYIYISYIIFIEGLLQSRVFFYFNFGDNLWYYLEFVIFEDNVLIDVDGVNDMIF